MESLQDLYKQLKHRVEFFEKWDGYLTLPKEIALLLQSGVREARETIKDLEADPRFIDKKD